MISGLFAVLTAIWYFNTARQIGKNSWLWAALGFICFQGAFTILTKVIVFPVSLMTPSIHNDNVFNSTLWLIVTALTVAIVMFVRTNYLKGGLVARDSVNKPVS
ncbi:MAG: hypothetical protein L0Y38_02980 [Methylococcaceae bacterium]|nr:hypothetical protein [Methylococcaceae bacterium]MCI0732771.1 hypothetical protein [Methylococcaceae bacterium]